MLLELIFYYLLFINIVAIFICIIDKKNAIQQKWRISEKTLFLVSILGGSVGMYLTMLKIRHKTKHLRFMLGLPIIILIQFFGFTYYFIDNLKI